MAYDGFEQWRQVARSDVVRQPGVASTAARIERWKIELLVIGFEVEEKLEHLVENFRRPSIGPIDLVDDDDGLEAQRKRLPGNELGLRHRAFGGVDEQDDSVHHAENPLDLGAKVGVAGRIHDVDVRTSPFDRSALGEDGDPALFLEIARIHRPLLDALVVAEGAGLAEELVDKRRLAVIDVGDDRHVAQIHTGFFRKSLWRPHSEKWLMLQCSMETASASKRLSARAEPGDSTCPAERTRVSRIARPIISRKAMKNAESPRRRPRNAPGEP
jgi:hypothetical protein